MDWTHHLWTLTREAPFPDVNGLLLSAKSGILYKSTVLCFSRVKEECKFRIQRISSQRNFEDAIFLSLTIDCTSS